jgi:triacylglycerol lipase
VRIHASILALVPLVLGACGSGAGPTDDPAAPVSTSHGTSPATPVRAPRPLPVVSTEGAGPPYPIVLLHGMGGFDQLNPPIDLQYFNGVIAYLASIGETQVFATVAPPYDTSEDRAAAIAPQLAQILQQTGKAKVNLIGHSQGGMDARVLVSPNGMALGAEVASVTTLATPNHGSLVADAVLGLLQDVPPATVQQVTSAALSLLEKTAYQVQTDPQLQAQLTEISQAYMTSTFNPKYVDDPRIPYSSYAGRTNLETGVLDCGLGVYADDPTHVDDEQPELSATAAFLQGTTDITNDGLVTVQSARWGTFLQCVPADHLKEVGMIDQSGADPVSGFDHLQFFGNVVARIRAAGF